MARTSTRVEALKIKKLSESVTNAKFCVRKMTKKEINKSRLALKKIGSKLKPARYEVKICREFSIKN